MHPVQKPTHNLADSPTLPEVTLHGSTIDSDLVLSLADESSPKPEAGSLSMSIPSPPSPVETLTFDLSTEFNAPLLEEDSTHIAPCLAPKLLHMPAVITQNRFEVLDNPDNQEQETVGSDTDISYDHLSVDPNPAPDLALRLAERLDDKLGPILESINKLNAIFPSDS